MDILIDVVVAGLAVSFLVESIVAVGPFSAKITRGILTLPLALLACWFLGLVGFSLVVAAPAAGFFSLLLSRFVNEPVTIQTSGSRRRQL